MRILFLLILSFICINTFGQKRPFKPVKSIIADINDDGKADTIILSSSLEGHATYNRISISLAGFPKKAFRAKDEWIEVTMNFSNGIRIQLLRTGYS